MKSNFIYGHLLKFMGIYEHSWFLEQIIPMINYDENSKDNYVYRTNKFMK